MAERTTVNTATRLKAARLIDTLTPAELHDIDLTCPQQRLHRGDPVTLGDDASDAFVLVRKGRVLFTSGSDDGRRIATVVVLAGDAYLRLATEDAGTAVEARAQEDSAVQVVGPELLQRLVGTNPDFAWHLVRLLGRNLENLEAKLVLQAFRPLPSRVAALLLRVDARSGEISLTHGTLAEGAGASREAVTRVLDQFQARGLVALSRNSVSILDRPGLEHLALEGFL